MKKTLATLVLAASLGACNTVKQVGTTNPAYDLQSQSSAVTGEKLTISPQAFYANDKETSYLLHSYENDTMKVHGFYNPQTKTFDKVDILKGNLTQDQAKDFLETKMEYNQ